MATGSMKLTTGGAIGVINYVMEDRIIRYYEEARNPDGTPAKRGRMTLGLDDYVFRADQFKGRGLEGLQISFGPFVTVGQVKSLLEGYHPNTGARLTKPGHVTERDAEGKAIGSKEAHTMGIDCFLSAPKSVSVLVLVASIHCPELVPEIIAAHEHAVDYAMNRVEATATLARRTVATPTQVRAEQQLAGVGAGGVRVVTKPGHERQGQPSKQQGSRSERVPVDLIRLTTTQFTARPTSERMADIHIHTHNVILGVGYDPVTGKAVQVDDYGLKSTAQQRDADYLGELWRRLHELGIETEERPFDEGKGGRLTIGVKGITQEAIDFFSTNHARKQDLQRYLEDKYDRAISGKAVQLAMRSSRQEKSRLIKAQDSDPDYSIWAKDAAAAGVRLAEPSLEMALRFRRGRTVERPSFEARRDEFLARIEGPNGVVMKNSTADRRALASAFSRCSEGLDFNEDERMAVELDAMDRLVLTNPDETERQPAAAKYSTRRLVELEAAISDDFALRGARTGLPRPSEAAIVAAIGSLSVEPDAEQQAIIRAATSGRGITLVEGLAGTGKTTSLAAVVDAGRLPSGRNGEPTWDQVIVVSTAALTAQGTGQRLGADRSMSFQGFATAVAEGLTLTERSLVIVDEAAQTNTFTQAQFMKAAGLSQVIMIGDPQQAQAIGPGGTFGAALKTEESHKLTRVWRQADPELRRDLLALRNGRGREVVESFAANGRLRISDTAAERVDDALAVYKSYRDDGIAVDDVRMLFDGSNKTVDEANRHIQRDRIARGEIDPEALTVDSRTEGRRWQLHRNDSVIFLQPYKLGTKRVSNGSMGVVEDLDLSQSKARVRLSATGESIDVYLEKAADRQTLGLAYAVHTAKYQGNEVDVALYLPSAGTSDKFTAYSATTRCKRDLVVFADKETHGEKPQQFLAQSWSRGQEKHTAMASIRQTRARQDRQQQQRDAEAPARPTPQPGTALSKIALSGDPHTPRPVDRYRFIAERVAGQEVAQQLVDSPAFPDLAQRLDTLRDRGLSPSTELRQAIRQQDLDGRQNPARDVAANLDHPNRREARSVPTQPDVAATDRQRFTIERVAGPELAEQITSSPAYPTLAQRLERFNEQGLDPQTEFREALRRGNLDGARDQAAVLVSRLDGLRDAQERRQARATERLTGRTPEGVTERQGTAQDWRERAKQRQLGAEKALSERREVEIDRSQQRSHEPDFGIEFP